MSTNTGGPEGDETFLNSSGPPTPDYTFKPVICVRTFLSPCENVKGRSDQNSTGRCTRYSEPVYIALNSQSVRGPIVERKFKKGLKEKKMLDILVDDPPQPHEQPFANRFILNTDPEGHWTGRALFGPSYQGSLMGLI
jgi:hypothetical protein